MKSRNVKWTESQSSRKKLVIAVLAFVVLLCLVGAWWLRSGDNTLTSQGRGTDAARGGLAYRDSAPGQPQWPSGGQSASPQTPFQGGGVGGTGGSFGTARPGQPQAGGLVPAGPGDHGQGGVEPGKKPDKEKPRTAKRKGSSRRSSGSQRGTGGSGLAPLGGGGAIIGRVPTRNSSKADDEEEDDDEEGEDDDDDDEGMDDDRGGMDDDHDDVKKIGGDATIKK